MIPDDYQIPQWFCVHTKPLHEVQAAAPLKGLTGQTRENVGKIEVYFPRIKTKMAVVGYHRLVLRPMFPRYFFARFVWEMAARYVASRQQVLGLVQFGRLPTIVPLRVIEELLSWSLEGHAEIFDPTAKLKAGQRVLITNGPFKGMEAEFISHLSDRKRVELLLDHLQSQPRLFLDRMHLKGI